MYRIDDPSAAGALPTPEASGTQGYFTEGNPASSIPATLVRASWLNLVQEEMMSVLTAASITPSKTTYNQLLTAIQALITGGVNTAFGTKLASANGYQQLPGGIIFQWGEFLQSDVASAATAYTFTLPLAFPNACLQAMANIGNFVSIGGVNISAETLSTTAISGFTYSPDTRTRKYRLFAIGY